MIESYHHEVIRKRRASRVFWLIVFLFAGFLYFFFQGYYPSINFSIRELFSSGGLTASGVKNDIIKSFGIINVSVKQKGAIIHLGSGSYSDDETRMTDYGLYALHIEDPGYLSYDARFRISKETPYYIDILTLLPIVHYSRIDTGITQISRIDDAHWSGNTASGMILFDESLSGKTLISPTLLEPIGEGYYLSGKTIMHYNTKEEQWISRSWSGASSIISECKNTPLVKEGKLWCKASGKVLTDKGKVLSGVVNIGNGYLETKRGLITKEALTEDIVFGTGAKREKSLFIEKEKTWYIASGGVLVSIPDGRSSIKTGLDEIMYTTWVDGSLIVIGRKGKDTFMTMLDPRENEDSILITFPDIPLEDVRIEKYDGNLFFKTRSVILFLYHNSEKIEWIIDGGVLTFGKNNALYISSGSIWKASWEEK